MTLRDHLLFVSNIFGEQASVERWVLENGREFNPQPLPPGFSYGEPRLCYENAIKVALLRDDLVYVEGYAFTIVPLEHAWVVDLEGNVIDPTWRSGAQYYGVPFKTDYVRETVLERKSYGVLRNYEDEFRLVRGLITEDEFKHPHKFP